MNSTRNGTLSSCAIESRLYTAHYLLFKYLYSTYLRVLIGPGILLNVLCLTVLSRSRLANKSTTIVFLRFLAIFDILAIALKYIRAELYHQAAEKNKEILFITPEFCKILFVCMNGCISIVMWTIVLMSVDKAVAVSYPLQSSIWVTQKRASYLCCLTGVVLFLANLPFISMAGVRLGNSQQKYCGLLKDTTIIDIITASILPIALTTTANLVIAVTLHRVSRLSFDWSAHEKKFKDRSRSLTYLRKKPSQISFHQHSSLQSALSRNFSQENKRRTSVQVTRMLLAVTLSLIFFNIPNTAMFLFDKISGGRPSLTKQPCSEVRESDIQFYRTHFYLSVIQDVLADLPHIVNFFLYCLAGRKFRSIFVHEVYQLCRELHLIKRTSPRLSPNGHGMHAEWSKSTGIHWGPRGKFSPETGPLRSSRGLAVFFHRATHKSSFGGLSTDEQE